MKKKFAGCENSQPCEIYLYIYFSKKQKNIFIIIIFYFLFFRDKEYIFFEIYYFIYINKRKDFFFYQHCSCFVFFLLVVSYACNNVVAKFRNCVKLSSLRIFARLQNF